MTQPFSRFQPCRPKSALPVLVVGGLLCLGLLLGAGLGGPIGGWGTVGGAKEAFPSYEAWARYEFARKFPGQAPLNWAIGAAAMKFYATRPMGKFVLGLGPGQWGNDCSDFVACAVDEGLGLGARFNRASDRHLLGEDPRIWEESYWDRAMHVQPGDVVSVRHSPWYEPYEGACWHVGVVGCDGMVYDFVKLRSWRSARYGRHPFEWFIRHSRGPRDVIIRRLAACYRYRILPLPAPSSVRAR